MQPARRRGRNSKLKLKISEGRHSEVHAEESSEVPQLRDEACVCAAFGLDPSTSLGMTMCAGRVESLLS